MECPYLFPCSPVLPGWPWGAGTHISPGPKSTSTRHPKLPEILRLLIKELDPPRRSLCLLSPSCQHSKHLPPSLRFWQGDIAICCPLLGRTRQLASVDQAWPSSSHRCGEGARTRRGLSLRGPSSVISSGAAPTRPSPHRAPRSSLAQGAQGSRASFHPIAPSLSYFREHDWNACLRNMPPPSSTGTVGPCPKLGPCPLPAAQLP